MQRKITTIDFMKSIDKKVIYQTENYFLFRHSQSRRKEKKDRIYIEINKVYFAVYENNNDTIKENASEETMKRKHEKLKTMKERAKIEKSQIKEEQVEEHEKHEKHEKILNNLNTDHYIHKPGDQVRKQVIKI